MPEMKEERLDETAPLSQKSSDGPRVKFPCGHDIGVSERSLLDPFSCPKCARAHSTWLRELQKDACL